MIISQSSSQIYLTTQPPLFNIRTVKRFSERIEWCL